jgi:hypothetical protein
LVKVPAVFTSICQLIIGELSKATSAYVSGQALGAAAGGAKKKAASGVVVMQQKVPG